MIVDDQDKGPTVMPTHSNWWVDIMTLPGPRPGIVLKNITVVKGLDRYTYFIFIPQNSGVHENLCLQNVEIQTNVCAIEHHSSRDKGRSSREKGKSFIVVSYIISGKEHHPNRHRCPKDRRILQLKMHFSSWTCCRLLRER